MNIYALSAVLFIGILSATSAKNHHGRTHHSHVLGTTNDEPQGEHRHTPHHETTNRMSPLSERRRDHTLNTQTGSSTASKVPVLDPSKAHTLKRVKKVSQAQTAEKKLLHGSPVEHNVNKKQLDNEEDGIQLEKEFLIHVTPSPPSKRKLKKGQGLKRRQPTLTSKTDKTSDEKLNKDTKTSIPNIRRTGKGYGKGSKSSSRGTSSKRYPKKYNPQKHGWKKSPKREKLSEKMKEKREKMKKREKKIRKAKNAHKTTNKNI